MGRIGDGLEGALDLFVLDLVHHQGQQDGHGEPHHQRQNADGKRILQNDREPVGAEQPLKILQPAPGAAQDAQLEFIVLEGDHHAVHGLIMKNQQIDQRRKHH